MSPPTIAEVRQALGYGRTMAQSADEKDWWDALLARLDPETQVIADRESLARALNRTKWWEHAVPGPLSVWTNPELADAVLAALRARR